MKVETRRKLIFTKEEQRVIAELQKVFAEDNEIIFIDGIWDILTDIANGCNELAVDYGYDIEIED